MLWKATNAFGWLHNQPPHGSGFKSSRFRWTEWFGIILILYLKVIVCSNCQIKVPIYYFTQMHKNYQWTKIHLKTWNFYGLDPKHYTFNWELRLELFFEELKEHKKSNYGGKDCWIDFFRQRLLLRMMFQFASRLKM